jgi:extracellular elastinolytic metalloproteinase
MNRFAKFLAVLAVFALTTPASAQPPEQARVHRLGNDQALTGPTGLPPAAAASSFVRSQHGKAVADSLIVRGSAPSPQGGVTHVRFGQEVQGLEVYGTYAKAAVDGSGRVVSVVENLATGMARGVAPARVGVDAALTTAIERHHPGRSADDAGYFYVAPTAERVALPRGNAGFAEGYLVVTWSDADNMLWHTVVDGSGQVVHEELRTNTDTYAIFPDHPGNSTQTVVSGPGAGNAESPIGWVFSDTTIGNNVDAYLDRDNNNAADPNGRPISSTQNFEYTVNLSQDPTTSVNQMAAVANLFYLNNVIHDKLYRHGFVEGVGNFQQDNFGKGGAGSDPVNAEAQDGGGTNNANFATPTDGSRPRMQMYLWTFSTPNRDGDLDSDIVWHEYGHGLTWRMIGSMSGALSGAIGEGMSDVLSIYINRDDVVGEYSYNNAGGIRRYPYTNYPLTYGDVTGSSVHNDGEIYAAAMWKLLELWEAAGLTQDELFDVVIDGMNFTPAGPAYEDMRDGILAASPTQAKDCIVWQAFAQFGIGEGASGTSVCRGPFNCSASISESFAVPSVCEGAPGNTAPVVAISSPANGAGFTEGDAVTFSGSASDTEDGDISASLVWTSSLDGQIGTGASFTTSTLSTGSHTVTASVTDSGGANGSDSISISVAAAGGNTAPTVAISSPANGASFTEGDAVTFSGSASDTEDGDISGSLVWTSSLDGQIGTGASFTTSALSAGSHTITASVTDSGGASGSDSISISVVAVTGGGISLSATGYKVQGRHHTDLTWSGATSTNVDVYRNGSVITTTANDGAHTDATNNRGGATYSYQVCEAGTATCSNTVSVVF